MIPCTNIITHEAHCTSTRAHKRQKTIDNPCTQPTNDIDEAADLAAAIALSLSKYDRDIPNEKCLPTDKASTASSLIPIWSDSSVRITETDWKTACGGWVWAHNAHKCGKTVDSSDNENAENKVLAAYRAGLQFPTVALGALGSCQLFSVCKAALTAHPKASTSGKWLLRISTIDIDELWLKIKHSVEAGELGQCAKTGLIGSDCYLICVYTKDFRDEDDVKAVYGNLTLILTNFYDTGGQNSSSSSGTNVTFTHKNSKITHSYKADIVTTSFSKGYNT